MSELPMPNLRLYTSNRLENLSESLAEGVRRHLPIYATAGAGEGGDREWTQISNFCFLL